MAWDWRPDNPAKGVKRYGEEKRERWLSDDELRRLCSVLNQHSNERASSAIRLQLLTGARLGEVLNARWRDFNFDRGVWIKPSHHTKQNRREHVPLSAEALKLLQAMASVLADADDGSAYLFPGDAPGKPLCDIKKFWKSVLLEARISDYRRHDNRHTYASHLVSSGLSLEIVGRLLGHTQPSTTRRYAHLADDPLRLATARFARKILSLTDTNTPVRLEG
jgi:integrase